AIKYSPQGGDVDLRVWSERAEGRSWAILQVRDHGMGIPAADLPRVFTWFFRGDNVAERVPGSGIGLAGAAEIIAQHGGTIDVESQEGVGSAFAVRLPSDSVESANDLLSSSAQPLPPRASPSSVPVASKAARRAR